MAGNGKMGTEMLDVLVGIRDEIKGLRGDTNARFAALEKRVEGGFAGVNARLDNLRDIAGEKYRDLDARVRVLENKK